MPARKLGPPTYYTHRSPMNEQLQLDLEVQCACGKTATRLCDGIVALVRDPNHDAFPVMVRLRENPIVPSAMNASLRVTPFLICTAPASTTPAISALSV